MPERINAVHQQPSSQIVFIKPLPGPDSAYAQDFLQRIAAICHPIMKSNHLRIMSLEEYEPNREFIGRNFNAGEIIQLVLRAQHTGRWLSFRTVQMVMMHELAHCLQMNHGREFWKWNNTFKGELRILWGRGYTGEGLWGRGRTLLSGEYDRGSGITDDVLPPHLCGGAYRSRRRRKRRRGAGSENRAGQQESYAEKKQRRIAKKFGVSGTTLGGDQDTRVKLENGQKVKGNPRIANSSRGRELRVAAALARFGQKEEENPKNEMMTDKKEAKEGSESGYSSDEYGDIEEEEDEATQAFPTDGRELRDAKGERMIRVCGNEDDDNEEVKKEMEELQELDHESSARAPGGEPISIPSDSTTGRLSVSPTTAAYDSSARPVATNSNDTASSKASTTPTSSSSLATPPCCPVCTLSLSPPSSLHASTTIPPVCPSCDHVLLPRIVPNSWTCTSSTCQSTTGGRENGRRNPYVNAGDKERCGICGSKRGIQGSS